MTDQEAINTAWIEKYLSECPKFRRKANSEYMMCSPLRKDTNPSFSVSANKGCFHDYGSDERGTLTDLAKKLDVPPPEYAGRTSSTFTFVPKETPKDRDAKSAKTKTAKIKDAEIIWSSACEPYSDSSYMKRKGLAACKDLNIRRLPMSGKIELSSYAELSSRGQLCVPIYNTESNDFQGVELIEENNGDKKDYGIKDAGCWRCGSTEENADVIICEGMATAATVAMLLPECTAICSFGVGNIGNVIRAIHKRSPVRKLIFAGDFGSQDVLGELINSKDKLQLIDAIPRPKIKNTPTENNTDWNDIYLKFGSEVAKTELFAPIRVNEIMEKIKEEGEKKDVPYTEYEKKIFTIAQLAETEFPEEVSPVKIYFLKGFL